MNTSYSKRRHIQESNLNLEKRIMTEQQSVIETHADSQLVNRVLADINKAMSGIGTDEDGILNALYQLQPSTSGGGWKANLVQKRKDYEYLLQVLRKKGFKTLLDWIKTDVSTLGSSPSPLGIDKAYKKDQDVITFTRKLEDLLSGKNDHM